MHLYEQLLQQASQKSNYKSNALQRVVGILCRYTIQHIRRHSLPLVQCLERRNSHRDDLRITVRNADRRVLDTSIARCSLGCAVELR